MSTSLDHIRNVSVNAPLKAPLRDGSSRLETLAFKLLAAGGGYVGFHCLIGVSAGTAGPIQFKAWSFLTATGASSLWYAAAARLIGRDSDRSHIKGLAVIAGTVGTLYWTFSLPDDDGRAFWSMLVMAGAAFVAKGVDRIEGDRYASAIHITAALLGSYALHGNLGKSWYTSKLAVSLPLTVYGGMQLPFIAVRGIVDAVCLRNSWQLSRLPDEPTEDQWKEILKFLNIDLQTALAQRLSKRQLWPILHLFHEDAVPDSLTLKAAWLIRNGHITHPTAQKAVLKGKIRLRDREDLGFLLDLQNRPLDKFDELLGKVDPAVQKHLLGHYLPHLPPRKWKELHDQGTPIPKHFYSVVHPDQFLAVPQLLKDLDGHFAQIGYAALVEKNVHRLAETHPQVVICVLAHCDDPEVAQALRATLPSPPPIPQPWIPWKGDPTDREVRVVPVDGSGESSVTINSQAAVVAGGHFGSALAGGWHTSAYKVRVPNREQRGEVTWLVRTIQEGRQPPMEELVEHMEVICKYDCKPLTELFYRRLAHEYRDVDLDSLAEILPRLSSPPADLVDYWADLEVNRENYRLLQLLGWHFEDLEHQARAATEWRLDWPEGWTPEEPLA
jgi:hypothetical protein